jgi:hypothetical protein
MGVTRCVSGDANGQISKWTMWVDGVCVSWSTPKYLELLASGQSTRRQEQSILHVQEVRLNLRHLEITQNTNAVYCGENFITGVLSNR